MPREVRSRITSKSSPISCSVSVAVGSSRIRTFASMASALAISTLCCSATVRLEINRPGLMFTPTRSRSSPASRSSAVNEPEAARFASHEEVLRDGEVGREGELLVEHRDP